jgi:hypothetical protein
MPTGLTIAQRVAAGKIGTPLLTDHFVFSRTTDGVELVGLLSDIANLVIAATQVLPTTNKTASYTAQQSDMYSLIEFTGTATQVLSLPTDAAQPLIGVGSIFAFGYWGTGVVTWPVGVVPGTPTIIGGVKYDVPLNLTIQAFVNYTWRKRAANEWTLS